MRFLVNLTVGQVVNQIFCLESRSSLLPPPVKAVLLSVALLYSSLKDEVIEQEAEQDLNLVSELYLSPPLSAENF